MKEKREQDTLPWQWGSNIYFYVLIILVHFSSDEMIFCFHQRLILALYEVIEERICSLSCFNFSSDSKCLLAAGKQIGNVRKEWRKGISGSKREANVMCWFRAFYIFPAIYAFFNDSMLSYLLISWRGRVTPKHLVDNR